jgi:hypothetical protein
MTDYAQSQLDLIEVFTWPPVRQPDMQSETTPSADTSVALNGSIMRNDPGLAKAAANVARWKTYLPQGCISSMMSEGWHWTT